ncbi:MAG: PAS domain S-box protein [Anaerolineae bacterium]|nr:PAS domain S-box protein [Anaerolineae bacterium]
MRTIEQFFQLINSDDADQTLAVVILRTILILVTLLNALNLLSDTLISRQINVFTMHLPIFLVIIGLWQLLRRGFVRIVGLLFSLLSWALLSAVLIRHGGPYNPVFGLYVMPIVTASFTVNRRWGLTFVVLSSVVGLFCLSFVDGQSFRPNQSPLTIWGYYSGLFVFVGLVCTLAIGLMRESVKRHREDRDRLLESNKALQNVIAAREQAEWQLSETQSQYAQLLQLSPVAVLVYDLDGKILYSNPASALILGVPQASDLIGHSAWDYLPTRSADTMRARLRSLTIANASATATFRVLRTDQKAVYVESRSTFVTYEGQTTLLVVLADISDRKEVEEALRRSEERFRVALANSPVIVFNQDTDLRYTWIYNLQDVATQDAILGQTDANLFSAESAQRITEIKQRVLQTREGLREEVSIERNGQTLDLDMMIEPLLDSQQMIIGITGAALDITERKAAERSLLEAERLRLDLSKEREVLEVKEQFISTLSHDFRTPLAVIMTSKDMIARYYDRLTPDRRDHHLHVIEDQVNYILSLLDDLLTIGRARAGKFSFQPEALDLVSFCQGLVIQVQTADRLEHQFEFIAQGNLADLRLDKKLLHHIIVNLLSNAAKYSPVQTKVALMVNREDDEVVIRVQDQGIGIPPEDQAKLFEPFHRAQNVGSIKGTGLGLAIVKESVETHGGTIICTSQQNVGTTFTVRLPLIATPVT